MCYDDQAQVPIPHGEQHPAHGVDVVLTASDGNQFAAFHATPDHTSSTCVLIYPDVRGLHQFYKDLAMRFAHGGIPALAIDYFGRTAGLTSRAEPFEFMPHVQQMTVESFSRDVQAGLDYLRSQHGHDARVFVVGFCMGGSLSIVTGTNADFAFAGLIAFYAGMSRPLGSRGTALDYAPDVRSPLLGLFGGDDQGIPQSQVEQLDLALDQANVEHQIIVYPNAPHSFFDRRAAQYAAESADAWQRILHFMGESTPNT